MALTDDLCRSWLDLLWHFDPAAGAVAGAPGAASRLGAFDVEAVREHLAGCRAIAGAVEDLVLSEVSDEIDRTALLSAIRERIAWFEKDEPHMRQPGFWLEHLGRALLPPPRHLGDPEQGAAVAEATLARLRAIPDFLASARHTLRKPPVVLADAAIAMAPALVEGIHDLVERLDPLLVEQPGELAAAATEAEAALLRLRMALVNEIRPDEAAHAASVGEERFSWILHHAFMLRASAGEVWRWGQTLADEAEARVAMLAGEIAPGQPWQDTFESVRESGLIAGDLLLAGATELARSREECRALRLLADRDGEIEVREAPAWLASVVPFTAYSPPLPSTPTALGVLYLVAPAGVVEPESVAWQRGELDRHRLAVLATHDGWPGRHAQAVAAAGTTSEVRRWVESPVSVSGWGCYAEELMVEEGPLGAPEDRLSQQVLVLVRALRVVVDAGIHTGQLTPAAALDLLMTRVPMDRHAALAEVRRICAVAGAASAYALGRREFLALRDSWRSAQGANAPLREFHESVFSFGRVPPTLMRWGMGLD